MSLTLINIMSLFSLILIRIQVISIIKIVSIEYNFVTIYNNYVIFNCNFVTLIYYYNHVAVKCNMSLLFMIMLIADDYNYNNYVTDLLIVTLLLMLFIIMPQLIIFVSLFIYHVVLYS